jgi:hypothetical protein
MSEKATTKSMLTTQIVKPAITAVYAGLLDRYFLNNNNLMQSVYFGGVVGAGVIVGTNISEFVPIPNLLPNNNTVSGKTLEVRAIEIGGTFVSAYALDFVTNSYTMPNYNLLQKLGIIMLADVMGELTTDFINDQSFSYLK